MTPRDRYDGQMERVTDRIEWHIGHVVRRLRMLAGVKQSELAEQAGLALSKIQRLEDRGSATLETVATVATVLMTSTAELTVYTEELNQARNTTRKAC